MLITKKWSGYSVEKVETSLLANADFPTSGSPFLNKSKYEK